MWYLVAFALCIAGYCFITDEIKYRKRLKKHKRGEVLEFL